MSENDKTEIIKALSSLEVKIDGLTDKLNKLDYTLYGNGKPGLIVQVDRNTQHIERSKWMMRAIVVAVVGLVVAAVAEGVKILTILPK